MTFNIRVIEAFTGKSEISPLAIKVRYKDKKKRIYVGFGEIMIPFLTNPETDIEEIEKKHDCKIKHTGRGWIITPNIVEKIIEKDGAITSFVDEHVKALEEWLNKHGAYILKEFVESKS